MPVLKNTGARTWYVKFANGDVYPLEPYDELTFSGSRSVVIPIDVNPAHVQIRRRKRQVVVSKYKIKLEAAE